MDSTNLMTDSRVVVFIRTRLSAPNARMPSAISMSERAERIAGLFVVAAIFISACVAGYEAILRIIEPEAPSDLGVLAIALVPAIATIFRIASSV